jgi:hypothetical protein
LLNVIDHKLKHNKNDMMTLRYSSDDQMDRWIEVFCFNYLRMSGKIVVART